MPYFDANYVASRHAYIAEIRTLVEKGLPEPQEDWDSIYVFSGPEVVLDPDNRPAREEKNPYNQTRRRLETAFNIARKVTSLKLKAQSIEKDAADLTLQDIRDYGPLVYFNGLVEHNAMLKSVIERKELARMFSFPDDKFIICGEGIKHTGEQIETFPTAETA